MALRALQHGAVPSPTPLNQALAEPATPEAPIQPEGTIPFHNQQLLRYFLWSVEVFESYERGCTGVSDNMYGEIIGIKNIRVSKCGVHYLSARRDRQIMVADL